MSDPYRDKIKGMASELAKTAEVLAGGNLLSAKISLWGAIQEVERKLDKGDLKGGRDDSVQPRPRRCIP